MDRILEVLTIVLIIALFSACSNSTEKNSVEKKQEQTVDKANPKTTEVKKEKPFPKPSIGKVKAFFTSYGKEHPETKVRLNTRLGHIDLKLYESTPVHRANFIYNIKEDLYYKTIFYRVVPDFMIQGGNSDNDKTLEKREKAGSYYIPNESKANLIHKRGAVAMAMTYDDNPENKSAQYSYYIVIGSRFSDEGLDAVEEEYDIIIPESSRTVYKQIGGAPHLDSKHTVFAEVIDGMDVVEAIADEKRDSGDWPVTDVVISYDILN